VFDVGGGQIGPFSLHMKRAVGKTAAVASPIAQPVPPVPSKPMLESIPTSSIPSTPKPTALSAAIVKPVSNFGLLEAAADAGLLFVTSPKVIRTTLDLFYLHKRLCVLGIGSVDYSNVMIAYLLVFEGTNGGSLFSKEGPVAGWQKAMNL
jgi:hypothetical protein